MIQLHLNFESSEDSQKSVTINALKNRVSHLAIGMGTSIEPRVSNLTQAIRDLRDQIFKVHLPVKMSSWYYSRACVPWGAKDLRPIEYINCVMTGATLLHPDEILRIVKEIELVFGRDINAKRWSPRPIDLDIIVYNNEPYKSPELTIPHPRTIERSWVLAPLAEIWPDAFVHHAPARIVQPGVLETPESQLFEPSSADYSPRARTNIDVKTILEYYAAETFFEKIIPAHIVIKEQQLQRLFFDTNE